MPDAVYINIVAPQCASIFVGNGKKLSHVKASCFYPFDWSQEGGLWQPSSWQAPTIASMYEEHCRFVMFVAMCVFHYCRRRRPDQYPPVWQAVDDIANILSPFFRAEKHLRLHISSIKMTEKEARRYSPRPCTWSGLALK